MSTADRLPWRTSSYSGNGEGCVDVAPATERVFVRHAKHHDQGVIEFSACQWSDFISAALGGRPISGSIALEHDGDDTLVATESIRLRFNKVEWTAFVAGATDGEFDFLQLADAV
ncbi:DUF397 domain-containing protein [Nocardia sp. CA-128927]|uniref:DUF397 domain-containing protein n=1 Tax=Nocardia sp. CA-128927 TaxID=3239975 RepID=UPI003D96AECD